MKKKIILQLDTSDLYKNPKFKKWKHEFIDFCRQTLVRWGWKFRRARLDAISIWDAEVVGMYDNNWEDIVEIMNDYKPVDYAKTEVFACWGE